MLVSRNDPLTSRIGCAKPRFWQFSTRMWRSRVVRECLNVTGPAVNERTATAGNSLSAWSLEIHSVRATASRSDHRDSHPASALTAAWPLDRMLPLDRLCRTAHDPLCRGRDDIRGLDRSRHRTGDHALRPLAARPDGQPPPPSCSKRMSASTISTTLAATPTPISVPRHARACPVRQRATRRSACPLPKAR